MTLSWNAPLSNGGCAISSFHIFKDDGAGGAFSEADAGSVNNIPSLRQHTLTFAGTETSKTFKIYMEADNIIGTI